MIIQALIAYVIVSILVQAPVLWIAGRTIVGAEKARFMDAVTITVLAVLVNAVTGAFLGKNVAGLVQLVAYLFLIVKYYETDWIKSVIVSVVNTVLGWIIFWVLVTFIGIGAIF